MCAKLSRVEHCGGRGSPPANVFKMATYGPISLPVDVGLLGPHICPTCVPVLVHAEDSA